MFLAHYSKTETLHHYISFSSKNAASYTFKRVSDNDFSRSVIYIIPKSTFCHLPFIHVLVNLSFVIIKYDYQMFHPFLGLLVSYVVPKLNQNWYQKSSMCFSVLGNFSSQKTFFQNFKNQPIRKHAPLQTWGPCCPSSFLWLPRTSCRFCSRDSNHIRSKDSAKG